MANALLLSVPCLTYHMLHEAVLRWLAPLNRRRLQVPMPLLAGYVAGLLWCRSAATCTAIAAGGQFVHDALNRLLIGPSLRGLLQLVALSLVDKRGGYLLVDDVLLEKHGPRIEGISRLRDRDKDYMWALNLVVLAWTDGRIVVPLSYRVWKPARSRDRFGVPSWDTYDGKVFHTKISLAAHMLQWASQRGFAPTAVVFDSFYVSEEVLKCCKAAGWQWASRIKGNRRLKREGQRWHPHDWGKTTSSMTAEMPSWGTVRLVRTRSGKDEAIQYLIGSNPNWGRGTILRLYDHRWPIEVLFRTCKQLVGLNDCQCRRWQAQYNHVALVFVAFCFLQAQSKRAETHGKVLARLSHERLVRVPAETSLKVRPIKSEVVLNRRSACHGPTSDEAA